MNDTTAARRLHVISAIAAVGGAILFVWSLRTAGTGAVFDGVRRLGAGFIVVWALAGVRLFVRAVAWRLCFVDGPPSIATAFATYAAGDAIGNVTPFGLLVSEPSKIVRLRGRVSPASAIPALTIENLFYAASVVAMLMIGTAALLIAFPLPASLRFASLAVLSVAAISAALTTWLILGRVRVASGLARRFGATTEAIAAIEDRVFQFAAAHPGRLAPLAALEASYHAAAVVEIWFALLLLTGAPPSIWTAVGLEYVNRTITIVFQFVPMWLGVDEAGTGLVAAALGIGPAAGVSLALARKARIVLWTAIGLALWWPRWSSATPRASSSAQSPGSAFPTHTPRDPAPAATASPSRPL